MCSDTDNFIRFLDSVKKIDVEHLILRFEPYKLIIPKFYEAHAAYPGHIKKYKYAKEILSGLDPERYIIYTDTEDVIFQKELPEFTRDLYLSVENVPTHKDTWWEEHIRSYADHRFDMLLDKPIYCSGTWACKVKTFIEYVNYLENMGGFNETKGFGDQLYFNRFLLEHTELTRYEGLDVFCSLHANIHRKDIYKEDGIWKHNGETIVCTHANGSLKSYL
jgi:hypothetical protein